MTKVALRKIYLGYLKLAIPSQRFVVVCASVCARVNIPSIEENAPQNACSQSQNIAKFILLKQGELVSSLLIMIIIVTSPIELIIYVGEIIYTKHVFKILTFEYKRNCFDIQNKIHDHSVWK